MEFVIAAVSSQFHIVPHEPTIMQNPSAVVFFVELLKVLKVTHPSPILSHHLR